jgi:DNA polymerase I-like protein with 3'-5' exonuclease and polymerase domains
VESNGLVGNLEELEELLHPILDGQVAWAAIDTETTLVEDERFTPYGTGTRVAGFSVSYDYSPKLTRAVKSVDFYAPLRHVPYDWRRPPEVLAKKDPEWFKILTEEEGVDPAGGWKAPEWDPNLIFKDAIALLQAALAAGQTRWVAHNWGFDGPMLSVDGLKIPWGRIEESQFLSQFTDDRPLDAWDEERNRYVVSHRLKDLGEDILGVPADAQARLQVAQQVLGKGQAKLQDFSMLPLRTALSIYACMDTRLTLRLLHHCRGRKTWEDPRIQERYRQEVALIPHIKALQELGVEIRPELARELAEKAEIELSEITRKTNEVAGRVLNFGCSEVLSQQLYGELQMPVYRDNTDTQKATLKMVQKRCMDPASYHGKLAPSVARDVLQGILDYRAKEKELTAFFRPLSVYGADGTIHTLIRQMAAATTRMSSAKPNLQQAKKKGEVRRVFKPRDGKLFGFLDYDQVEMRLAAHYAKMMPESFRSVFTWSCTMAKRGSCKGRGTHGPKDDAEACRKVIHTGRFPSWQYRPAKLHLYEGFMTDPTFDPHQRMADVAGVERDVAKTSNFALLYGAGYNKLAETLDCTRERAKELFHFFWDDAYPELNYVRGFIDERLRRVGARTKFSHSDFITTLKGGRIHLDSGYKGFNYVVQRSAREVFGDGFLEVCLLCEGLDGYDVVMPTHDEVTLEIERSEYDVGVLRQVAQLMRDAGSDCSVPLTVGCEVSDQNWHKDDREEVVL